MQLDTCALSLEELLMVKNSFQQSIELLSGQFDFFTIMEHDSAICANKDISSVFNGMNLLLSNRIGFRTPYIAIITKDKIYEYDDIDSETSIALDLN